MAYSAWQITQIAISIGFMLFMLIGCILYYIRRHTFPISGRLPAFALWSTIVNNFVIAIPWYAAAVCLC